MADDAQVQITIAASLDGSVASAATAAKEQLDELGASAETLGTNAGAATAGVTELSTAATAASAATETAAAGAEKASGAFITMDAAAQVGERMFDRLTLAAIAFGTVDFEKSAFGDAADIQRTADMLGLTTDQVQAFQYAMRQAGEGTDVGNTALRRFMSNLGELQSGGEAASAVSDAIKTIGLTADELAGDPFAALQKVAQGILNEKDATTQAYVEHELFGRSGQSLNAVLSLLAGGFDTLKQKASDAGEMLDEHTTKGALDTEIAFGNLTTKIKDDFAEGILDAVEGLQNFGNWLGTIRAEITGPFVSAIKAGYDALNAFDAALWPKGGAAFNQELDARIAKVKQYQAAMKALPSSAGGLGLQMEAPQVPTAPEAPQINIVDEKQADEQANKAAEIAQRLSDTIAQDANSLAQKQISAAVAANNFELQMGQESLEQWKANAVAEADAKLNGELAYLEKKAAADKGNVVEEQKDLDAIRAAHQEHADQLAQIDQQYAEKKRALDQQELQDAVKAAQDELKNKIDALDAELKAHQITAQQKYDQEMAYVNQTEALINQLYAAALAGMDKESAAYQALKKQELAAQQQFVRQAQQASDQLETEEAQKWTQLGNSIKSSFNSALDGMIFEGHSFQQFMLQIAEGVLKAFLSMGEEIAENWIETQIAAMFETKTTQGTAALGQVQDAAAVAGANAYAAYAAFPPVAASMAADAVATTEGFSGLIALATGAWDLKSDTVAQLHKGEMVVPENFASGLRGHGGLGGGGDVNMHYGPTINARDPASLSQMLTRESGEMLAWMKRQMRNGALRA